MTVQIFAKFLLPEMKFIVLSKGPSLGICRIECLRQRQTHRVLITQLSTCQDGSLTAALSRQRKT
jgi:hypothetical protein